MAEPLSEDAVLAAVRAGDEDAVARLLDVWSPAMLRTAMALTGDRAVAEEVVRVLRVRVPREVGTFRPPPGLRAWVFGRLLALARAAGLAAGDESSAGAPPVDPARFLPVDDPEWPGHWKAPPTAWPSWEDGRPASPGPNRALRSALAALPTAQRIVVGLRDVAGCQVDEIVALTGQRPGEVRHLLNQGRARLRTALESYLATSAPA